MIEATDSQVSPAINTTAPVNPTRSPMPGLSPWARPLSRYSATTSPAMAARNPIGIAIQPGHVGGPGDSSSNRGRVRPRGRASPSGEAAAMPGAAYGGALKGGTEPGVGSESAGGAGSNGRGASKRCQELVARRKALVSGASSGTRSVGWVAGDAVLIIGRSNRSSSLPQ